MEPKTQEYKKLKKKNKIAKIIFYSSIAILILSIVSAITNQKYISTFTTLILISLILVIPSNKIRKKTNYIIEQIEINKIANKESEKN